MAHKNLSYTNVNSSFTVLYVASTIVWGFIFAGYFPPEAQRVAFGLNVLFALVLYVFRYLLNQFADGVSVLKMILLYYVLAAGMSFLSAVIGPVAHGTIPIISILNLNAQIVTYVGPAFIVGSVFSFYGAVTLICSLVSTSILEVIYVYISSFLPHPIKSKLLAIDAAVDTKADRALFSTFYTSEFAGMAITAAALLVYTIIYVIAVLSF